ncbi:MAG: carbohydrate ABC transporter permease [Anaerolineae bacterium]
MANVAALVSRSMHRQAPATKRRHSAWRQTAQGLIFIFPWLVGLVIFVVYPIIASAYYSLTDYTVVKAARFIGLDNYRYLLAEDRLFFVSLQNTLYYAAFFIPLSTVIAIGLALVLNMKVRGMAFYRTVFYLPSIVPAIASAMLWMWILNPQYGMANELLRLVGLPRLGWLADPTWSKPSLVLMSLWGAGGGMVIFLAGLQDIPKHLYEAAELDGATPLARLVYVTLPLLTPSVFFNLVIDLIGAFQYFTAAYVMTSGDGGPMDSTLFYAMLLYNNAFRYFKMGRASAMAWILFVLVFALTYALYRSSDRWVHYGSLEH